MTSSRTRIQDAALMAASSPLHADESLAHRLVRFSSAHVVTRQRLASHTPRRLSRAGN